MGTWRTSFFLIGRGKKSGNCVDFIWQACHKDLRSIFFFFSSPCHPEQTFLLRFFSYIFFPTKKSPDSLFPHDPINRWGRKGEEEKRYRGLKCAIKVAKRSRKNVFPPPIVCIVLLWSRISPFSPPPPPVPNVHKITFFFRKRQSVLWEERGGTKKKKK